MLLHRRLLNSPDAPAYVNGFRRRGWVVVQEFDDDPAHWPVIAQTDHFAFRGVHAVQTTTPRLEALFRRFNEEIGVFPNTVAELPEPANFAHPRRLTLFLGALRREEDMAPFLPVLNEVLAEADGRLAVEVLFDRGTFDALRTPHKRFGGILPYAEYRALMSRCEIAFLPLNDTPFNNFKSDLKFVRSRRASPGGAGQPGRLWRHGEDGEPAWSSARPEEAAARAAALPRAAGGSERHLAMRRAAGCATTGCWRARCRRGSTGTAASGRGGRSWMRRCCGGARNTRSSGRRGRRGAPYGSVPLLLLRRLLCGRGRAAGVAAGHHLLAGERAVRVGVAGAEHRLGEGADLLERHAACRIRVEARNMPCRAARRAARARPAGRGRPCWRLGVGAHLLEGHAAVAVRVHLGESGPAARPSPRRG
jgi:hypothetical protein